MDAETTKALAAEVAKLNVAYVLYGLVLIVGVFTFLAALGERAIGLSFRGIVDAIEERAKAGDVWPAVVSFIVTPSCLFGLVLWIGLR